MTEYWKDIVGYEGMYQISSLGRVRGVDRVIKYNDGRIRFEQGRVLSLYKGKDSYLRVGLTKSNKHKTHLVHCLVANAFVEKIKGKNYVDHIDGNRTNNNFTNLRWCTISENNRFPLAIENRIKGAEKMNISVAQYDKELNFIRKFNGANEARRFTGVWNGHITECCQMKRKTAGGYIWRYV